MFDQQPVRTFATIAIALHAHQHPATVQTVALEHELQLARAQLIRRRFASLCAPEPAIP